MSASLAAARKRRGGTIVEPPQQSSPQSIPSKPSGLTLPQVIALVDNRLLTLESFMKEQTANVQPQSAISTEVIKQEVEMVVEEFNNRYELLATEIQSIKDIVLKLQSYTMEVNRTLMEERVRVLSDLGQSDIVIGEVELEQDV